MNALIQVPEDRIHIIPLWCRAQFRYNLIDEVFIATNSKQIIIPKDLRISESRIHCIYLNQDMDYGSNMIYALNSIPDEIIYHSCEDHILARIPDAEIINNCYKVMLKNKKVGSFRLNGNKMVTSKRTFNGQSRLKNYREFYAEINDAYNYLFAISPSFFRKEYLLQILRDGENAWKSEIEGSRRAQQSDFIKLCALKDLALIHNFISRGKNKDNDRAEMLRMIEFQGIKVKDSDERHNLIHSLK